MRSARRSWLAVRIRHSVNIAGLTVRSRIKSKNSARSVEHDLAVVRHLNPPGSSSNEQKPESERKRVGEDQHLVGHQLEWINQLVTKERMTVLVSHDDIMLPQFAAQGLLVAGVRTQ